MLSICLLSDNSPTHYMVSFRVDKLFSVGLLSDKGQLTESRQMAKSQKPKGRPALPENERRLKPMSFRPDPNVRQRIEDAAGASGRSLSQEIEFRLLQTLEAERQVGGPELWALFKMMGAAVELIEQMTGKTWKSNHETSTAIFEAWYRLIEEFLPDLEPRKAKEDFALFKQLNKSMRDGAREIKETLLGEVDTGDDLYALTSIVDALAVDPATKSEIATKIVHLGMSEVEERYGKKGLQKAIDNSTALTAQTMNKVSADTKEVEKILGQASSLLESVFASETVRHDAKKLGEDVSQRLLPPRKGE